MTSETNNAPRTDGWGAVPDSPAGHGTRCYHLGRASHWVEMAERHGHSAAANILKLAELHVMLADRVESLEDCGA